VIDLQRLADAGLIGDGPFTPLLAQRGLPPGVPADAAAVSHPQLVADAARAFIDAGATLLCTDTLAANRLAIQPTDRAAQCEDINRSAVALLRGAADAAGRPVAVAGQIGPSGRFLQIGEVSEVELRDAFAEQAAWLAKGGADLLLLGRFLDLDELLIALAAAKAAAEIPVVAALVFDSGAERLDTPAGQSPAQAAEALAQAGAAIVGCDRAAPEIALTVVGLLIEHSKLPVFVRTFAGQPELDEGRIVYPESPAEFASRAAELRRRGAAIVAGCSGTTPEHIRALAAAWPAPATKRPRR